MLIGSDLGFWERLERGEKLDHDFEDFLKGGTEGGEELGGD